MLIRNNGFESGDLSFWEHTGDGALTLDDTNAKYGTYCGKIALGGGESAYIVNSDYIKIGINQPLVLSAWVKGSGTCVAWMHVKQYDAGLNLIDESEYGVLYLTTSYQNILNAITPLQESVYVKVGLKVGGSGAARDVYVDDMTVRVMSGDVVLKSVCLIETLDGISASGDSSMFPSVMDGFSEYVAELDASIFTGGTPTANITVCELDQSGNEIVLATFAEITGAANQRVAMSAPMGHSLYVKYVLTGTTLVLTMKNFIIGRR